MNHHALLQKKMDASDTKRKRFSFLTFAQKGNFRPVTPRVENGPCVENGRVVALVVTLSYKSMQYNKKNA